MILRLGLPVLLLLTSPIGRGCSPAEPGSAASDRAAGDIRAAAEAAAPEEPTPEPTPAPPPRIEYSPDAFATPSGELAAAGTSLRLAAASLESGAFEEVLTLVPAATDGVVDELSNWLRARALRALDRLSEADAALAAIPATSRYATEARILRGQIALEQKRPVDALALVEGLDEPRADMVRARAHDARKGDGDTLAAYRAALQVWTSAPRSGADADAETLLDALEADVPVDQRRTLADATLRAEALGARSIKKEVVDLLGSRQDELVALAATDADAACRGLYQLGRAWHKQREYGKAVPIFEKADAACPTTGDDRVKTLYLLAQARARSGDVDGGIRTFLRLPDEHAEHSYADDGLWQASRLALDDGRLNDASAMATRLTREFPEGDMRGDTLWNLAWSALADQRPSDALPWLETMGEADPYGPQREHVLQGRYWTARVLLEIAPDRRAEALDSLAALALDHPLHWYGALAGWRLQKEDPERGAQLSTAAAQRAAQVRAASAEPAVYRPLRAFVEDPQIAAGLRWLEAGLPDEAAAAFGQGLGSDPLETWDDPDTWLFASHVLELAGDPNRSHNLLRAALKHRFPEATAEQAALLRHAWPRAFGGIIDQHTADYDWDPLLFQGLVREESAFAPGIVSWAGAMGLSQLMWPTAKETARRMGLRINRSSLDDPSTNVDIGATYFEGLAQRWKGHLPLAVASYNAGPGAVNKWVEARGDLELDAWVETIPYDQTRHYVKRVVSSWQAYKYLYGAGSTRVPLRIGPVARAISQSDPTEPG